MTGHSDTTEMSDVDDKAEFHHAMVEATRATSPMRYPKSQRREFNIATRCRSGDGSPFHGSMLAPVRHVTGLLVSVLWIATALVWAVLVFNNKRTVARRGVSGIIPVIAVFALVVAPSSLKRTGLHHQLWVASSATSVVAVVVVAVGAVFAIWARLTIGRNWSGTVTLKQDHELVQRGPYGLARHPIYTGLLTMCVGTMVLIGIVEFVVILVVGVVYVMIKVPEEEKLMGEAFPAQYPEYRRRVKAIIPFVL